MATGARCNEWMQIFQPETLCVWLRGQILHPRRRAVRNRDCFGGIKWLQGNQLHLHCVDCRVQTVDCRCMHFRAAGKLQICQLHTQAHCKSFLSYSKRLLRRIYHTFVEYLDCMCLVQIELRCAVRYAIQLFQLDDGDDNRTESKFRFPFGWRRTITYVFRETWRALSMSIHMWLI